MIDNCFNIAYQNAAWLRYSATEEGYCLKPEIKTRVNLYQ